MNIFRLSLRNMTDRPLSTTLSLVLLTLGVGMIALMMQINRHIQEQMEKNIKDIDMVVGAKGSPLQLILSAVYHIDSPTGNISLKEAEKLRKNRFVEFGIPLSYGDSYEGYRIVGTNHEYVNLFETGIADGKLWDKVFEVTVGSTVAKNLNLKLGDQFAGAHGLSAGGETHGNHMYTVVGILNYSNSVLDQLILTPTESVWEVHNEEHEGTVADHTSDESENEDREITAMLVKFRSPMGLIQIPRRINEDTKMQSAVPSFEINRLFSLMGVGVDTLSAVAFVIMAVSGLSVFISLYNALRDRQYEMALMRTYGATRWQLVRLVLQEGILLVVFGFLLGWMFSRLGLWLVSGLMESSYHYEFSGWVWVEEEVWLLVISLAIGLLASLVPALRVFRINISKTLAID